MSCPYAGLHKESKEFSKADHMAGMLEKEGPKSKGCKWALDNTTDKNPHPSFPLPTQPKIYDSILQRIGDTPLVRINSITKEEGIECEVLAKCEFFNAGGSVKDRIGRRMVEDAEKAGIIKPGVHTLIEPTSGNTGIGLALAAAIKGYRMIITLPEKMSQEKVDVLKALGAEIIRTPTEAASEAPDSHISVAKRLEKEIPNGIILDQYCNPSNPMAHYEGTAEELLRDCDGKIDVLVAGAGTGGTISGIARKLKEKLPNIRIVGVDPYGSLLSLPQDMNKDCNSLPGYQVEGIGYDFIPDVLDRTVIDDWVKSEDQESFSMARRLIRQEGLLCGGSSGSAMAAAVRIAKTMKKGERLVVVLPDSVRNYMTKFLNDSWMVDHEFMAPPQRGEWWATKTVSDLTLQTPLTVNPDVTCERAVSILKSHGFNQLPVVEADGTIAGMLTLGNLMQQLLSTKITATDPVSKALYKQFKKVSVDTTLNDLEAIFEKHHFALIVSSQKCFDSSGEATEKSIVFGVVTPIDLTNFIVTGTDSGSK